MPQSGARGAVEAGEDIRGEVGGGDAGHGLATAMHGGFGEPERAAGEGVRGGGARAAALWQGAIAGLGHASARRPAISAASSA